MTHTQTQGADGAGTLTAAERVCHEEQMTIWSGEVVGRLNMGGCFRDDLTYDDLLEINAAISEEIRSIVGSAFDLATPAPRTDGGMTAGEDGAWPFERTRTYLLAELKRLRADLHTIGEDLTGEQGKAASWLNVAAGRVANVSSVLASATPAQPAGAVPDSLRALSEAASQGPWRLEPATTGFRAPAENDAADMMIVAADSLVPGVLWDASYIDAQKANIEFTVAAVNFVRSLLASHPAGQSATAEPDPTLTYWIESETERLCNLYPDAAASIVEFREELVGLMEGNPAGQSARSGAEDFSGKFWLHLREPRRVPDQKGPFPSRDKAKILREFMTARPQAYISVVTVDYDGPEFEDGPQALQILDGRSMVTGSKHIERVRAAHGDHSDLTAPDSTRTGDEGTEALRGLISEVADAVFAIGRATLSEQQVDRAYTAAERLLDYRDRNLSAAALAARPAAPEAQGAWRVGCEQLYLDASAAIEGVAQELEAIDRTASAKMLRNALDTLLGVEPNATLPAADDATKRIVAHAWERFQRGVSGHADKDGGHERRACENCGGQKHTDMGTTVCSVCAGTGVETAVDSTIEAGTARGLDRAPPSAQEAWRSQAANDVLAERRRQIEAEGWTAEHDDTHSRGELASAAACYATELDLWTGYEQADRKGRATLISAERVWPWSGWWKPTDRRRNLVKAGALILAEIERLDRLPAPPSSGQGGR